MYFSELQKHLRKEKYAIYMHICMYVVRTTICSRAQRCVAVPVVRAKLLCVFLPSLTSRTFETVVFPEYKAHLLGLIYAFHMVSMESRSGVALISLLVVNSSTHHGIKSTRNKWRTPMS
jgi:hypothetical protein